MTKYSKRNEHSQSEQPQGELHGSADANHLKSLPKWHYEGVDPRARFQQQGAADDRDNDLPFPLPALRAIDLGSYRRDNVSNCPDGTPGRAYFDLGLRLMLSYQHEMAALSFLACLHHCPHCVLAHGLVALCHSPNYNFKGDAYYESALHEGVDEDREDWLCQFPSQIVAERHSHAAMQKLETLRKQHKLRGKPKGKPASRGTNGTTNSDAPTTTMVSDVEARILAAIRALTCFPGVSPDLADETVGRPYAAAMRKVHAKYPHDPEVCYCFAESLMVLNAWHLYEYPSGAPRSPDVVETRAVLEAALQQYPRHAGLCHMYVHLSEMSAHPELAETACPALRQWFPHAGHLIHMPTHIDVLVGDYTRCVQYNKAAIAADLHNMQISPATAGRESFYFGYSIHNFHMGVYGCILGGFEQQAMELAQQLNGMVNEAMFEEHPNLVVYLETYAALEIHVLVRFGRWQQILELKMPRDKTLMLYRSASLRYARALALAAHGNVVEARKEADRFDALRVQHPDAEFRILHNNTVADLLAVDAVMMRGEIAYREEKYGDAFKLLRKAVQMQDNLIYDEPWGKMQPIRHALGGLLLEQGRASEAAEVFREDLRFHPKNPWALVGLLSSLKNVYRTNSSLDNDCCTSTLSSDVADEISRLESQLAEAKGLPWADFTVEVACECCQR